MLSLRQILRLGENSFQNSYNRVWYVVLFMYLDKTYQMSIVNDTRIVSVQKFHCLWFFSQWSFFLLSLLVWQNCQLLCFFIDKIVLLLRYTMSRIDAKVVLLGKSYTGKTCLVNRYTREAFDQNLPYQNTRLFWCTVTRYKKLYFLPVIV